MVLKLESKIMKEIGLGNHYSWYAGSGSCPWFACAAANGIAGVIQKYHDAGELISAPDEDLINLLIKVAEFGETSKNSLQNTWQAASDIISRHIRYSDSSEKERKKGYAELKDFIEENYLLGQPLEGIKLD